LSDREKAILIKWIEQGAVYQPHWAFMPVKKFDTEEANIDYFISKKLKEQNFSFSKKANKETLIRRLYFDITGLPPSVEAIDAFLADTTDQAYENIVDNLLASPEYGERMAAYWMDVARYTDSDGYLDDKHRDFSPWRDWVIRAFNQNLPYDSFVTWQLAGDLLPNPTQEQILATAFNRLHKKNSEAGIVFEEYRVEYVADRTNTFGKAFLGLSLECARCHDHKYDPISQKEYFEYFAFFNSTDEIGHAVYGPDQTPGPALLLTTPEVDKRRKFLEEKYRQAEKKVNQQAVVTQVKNDIQYAITEKTLNQNLQKHLVSHLSFDQIKYEKGENATTPDLAKKNKHGTLKSPDIKPGIKGNAFFVTDYNYGRFPEKVRWLER
ncbi:MAG: DUF1549 domain-containing protein, partial [Bacteroidetes bacterium]|nr:DUF1549 domain-containing protein [Bacteroidota bacterium]